MTELTSIHDGTADSPLNVNRFDCPGCFTPLDLEVEGRRIICPNCGWKGVVTLFDPVELQIEQSQEAMPDDATCVHHPNKRAEKVCDGTGIGME